MMSAACLATAGEPGQADYAAMLAPAVSIKVRSTVTTDYLGDSVWSVQWGSGFVVTTAPCEIWTNFHTVSEAATIEVYAAGDQTGREARLHAADPRSDVAVLRLADCPELSPVRFGDSDRLRRGDTLFAVGNPFGRNPGSLSSGIVSHTYRLPVGDVHFLQTDAVTTVGNSGGGLYDRDGRLVAVVNSILVDGRKQPSGFTYAVPSNLLRRVVERLRKAPARQSHIGLDGQVANLEAREARALGVPEARPALIVTRPPERAPARGALEVRDILFALDGAPLTDIAQLRWLLNQKRPGETVQLGLVRGGRLLEVGLPVADEEIPLPRPHAERYAGYLGMRVEPWRETEEENDFFETPIITQVMNLGPAHYAGIRSSQHYLVAQGFVSMPRLVEVRTVTGVIDAARRYTPVTTAAELDALSAAAATAGSSLVLEVQEWIRSTPRYPDSPLIHRTTTYHLVTPRPYAPQPPSRG